MTMRILKTKLFVPPLRPEVVARPALMARLDDVRQRPLALISAPAGFGKTTLVVNWIEKNGDLPHSQIAWLSLEENDNDPVRFLRYMVAALQTAVPDLPDEITEMLHEETVVAVDGFLTDLLNALTAVSQPIILVLDDYHLIQDEDIHAGLAFLIDHMPPDVHLIMTTREDPPLPLARLRGRGQLIEIRQADLSFTEAEAAQFLNGVMGLELTESAVTALAERTEGWITGLQMAAVSMQGQDDADGFVAAFTGSHRYVLDYLMEEVWQRQPSEIQHFLLQTAVLDELCAPLCERLMIAEPGVKRVSNSNLQSPIFDHDSQAILEYLDRTNLFIIPLDEARQWYRYHHLFADLLRQRLQQTAPELMRVRHGLAGEWYAENGRLPEAIDHFLQGAAYDRAAALILQMADAYLMRSEVDTLLNWIDALPDEVLGERPLLFVYQAGAFLLGGRSFKLVEARLAAALAHSEGAASGEVNVLRGLIAAFRGNVEESKTFSQEALRLLPPENSFLRSLVVQNMALAEALNGDVPEIINGLLLAADVCEAAGNVMSQVICLVHVAEFHILGGQLFEAQKFYGKGMAVAVDAQKRPLPIMGLAKMGLGEVEREWNHLNRAEELLTEGLDFIQRWGEIGGMDGYVWLSRVRQAQGDMTGALAVMERAGEIAARFDASELDDYFVGVFRTRLDIKQGRLETAVRWVTERDLLASTPENTSYYMWELGRLTLIRVSIAQQSFQQAVALINEVLPHARRLGRKGVVIDVLSLQSVALFHSRQPQEAQSALQKALVLAEPERYMRTFIDKGEPIRQLFLMLQQTSQPATLQTYITQLLAVFQSPLLPTQSPVSNLPSSHLDPLSDRELEVLHLIAAGYTNREISGQLFVAQSTVKTHINHIYSKLGVTRRAEAVTRAREIGLIND